MSTNRGDKKDDQSPLPAQSNEMNESEEVFVSVGISDTESGWIAGLDNPAALSPPPIPKVKFKTADELNNYLQQTYPGEFKLFPTIPFIMKQRGATCKITAFTNVLNYHYQLKNITKTPLPIITDDKSSTKSAEQIVKMLGSEVGRIYNEKMARDFIKLAGEEAQDNDVKDAKMIFQRFDQTPAAEEQYINFIKDTVDQGVSPPVIFFDVAREAERYGLPNPSGAGEHEHGAIVVGYCNTPSGLAIILGHWGQYFIVNASDLAKSAANLKVGTQPDRYYYRIKGEGIESTWFRASDAKELTESAIEKIFLRKPRETFELSPLEIKSIVEITQTLQSLKSVDHADITVIDEKTNEKLIFTGYKTPGTLTPVENDLRSTVCVIVPRTLQLRLDQAQQKLDKQPSSSAAALIAKRTDSPTTGTPTISTSDITPSTKSKSSRPG